MPTLNQLLRSFPTESRAVIFLQCRQDCPLPPPINRGGFQGLRGGGNRVQSKPKNQPLPGFCHLLCLSLSLSLFVILQPTAATTTLTSIFSTTTSTTSNRLTTSHGGRTTSLSLLCKTLLLCHRDPSSSSNNNNNNHNHLVQPLSSFPIATGAVTLSSSTSTAPTVSN